MRKANAIKIVLTSLLLSIFSFSCEIGLGDAVDITAPELTITAPSVSQSVPKSFVISGYASDETGIGSVSIVITGDDTVENIKWEKSGWKRLNNGTWENYSAAKSTETSKRIEFSIPVDASWGQSGHEYSITTKVTDTAGNEGGKSKDERNVVIDIKEPVVSIIEPERLSSPTDPEFATYVLKNNSILPKIKNGTFTVSGSQREDTSLDYLVVYIDSETSTISAGETTVYPVANPLVKKVITGTNLRNWSTTITPDDFTDKSILAFDRTASDAEKNAGHILRLVTESHDQAGNVEIKSQGWFKFNNGAEIPWVTATFGQSNVTDAEQNANWVYPRCSLQGQAYDDDGLKSISIKIYESDGVTLISDYSVTEETLAAEGYPSYKAWSLRAVSESKTIVIKINCTDKNGVTGDEVVRYMHISDVNAPKISNLSPANGSAVLGDAGGSFSFTGQVDDDGDIAFVKIVRIKSGNDSDQINYFNNSYSGWTSCTSTAVPYTDANGNKVWQLALSTPVTDANNRKVCTWNKTFNIFNDFGIDGTEKLTNQKFIILAQDTGGSANLEAYTLQGDIDPPVITIDKIYLNTNSESYELKDEPIELPKPFNRDSNLNITDKIKITGTWSDNSTTNWTDKSKHGPFVLTVANKIVSVTVNTDGTWTTDFFTPADSSVSVINASLTDFGGNTTNKSKSYYVNSSTPVLSRIGAETPDGAYTTGKEIEITMEFNKAVEFTGGTPVLILNAGSGSRTATYKSGNKNSKHIFTYTVQSGDDVAKLNVTGIRKDGITWKDTSNAEVSNLTIPTTGGSSLGGGRSIVIDTTAPTLTGITAISGSGWNKAGKSIFIQATFSEDISITPKDLKDFKLVFNNGAKTDSNAAKTGSKTVLFKYIVQSGDAYTDKLQVASVETSGYKITDVAGNELTSIITLPNNLPSSGSNVIKIDTDAPAKPVIKGLPSVTGANKVYADNFKFSIEGFETDASEKKYTLDGSTWLNYTGEITVSNNGNYIIKAYQVDSAGNRSEESASYSRILNTNKFISYITSEQSDGTYTTDDTIVIKVICKEKLTVSADSSLTLNTTPVKKASYLSGSGTTELKYGYKVAEGDACNAANGLTVTAFTSTVLTDTNTSTSDNVDVSSRCELPSSNNLSDNRTINVVTGVPVIQSVTVDQSGTYPVMKIKFSTSVSKKAGKYIQVSQTYEKNGTVVYNAPAVLTKSQYNNFKAVDNDIDTYFEKGVNGLKSDNATADLSEKYVLKFEYDGTTTAVRNFFKSKIIDTTNSGTILDVFIPIASSKVSVSSTDKTTLLVNLTDSYALPVKGAEYTITVPADIAVDSQGHTNQLAAGKTYSYQQTFTLSGAEKPAIRVNKSECTISGGKATQPLTAKVKMDCQTPNKAIKYSVTTLKVATKNVDNNSLKKEQTTRVKPETGTKDDDLSKTDQDYTVGTTIDIGTESDKSSGYKITLDAYVMDGTTKVHAYESANRSVVRLKYGTPSVDKDWGNYSSPGTLDKMYIRGGDSESGNSSTLGFPLSWNSSDYGKVKMMTQEGEYWYYASWNISVNLYYGFLCGNTGADDADTMANGPYNWCWATQSWVSRKQYYYLEPGTSFSMIPADSYGTGAYTYQGKHLEYRPQATKTNGYGALVNSIN